MADITSLNTDDFYTLTQTGQEIQKALDLVLSGAVENAADRAEQSAESADASAKKAESAQLAAEKARDSASQSAQAAEKEHQDIQAYVTDSKMEMMDLVGLCEESASNAKYAENGAEESKNKAEEAASAAESARDTAQAMASDASESATSAKDTALAVEQWGQEFEGKMALYEERTKTALSSTESVKSETEGIRDETQGIRDEAEGFAIRAETAAEAAEKSADTAKQYSGKPPQISDNGTWEIWNAESGEYQDTGKKSIATWDKTYASEAEMEADAANQPVNTVAIISSGVEQAENARVYIKATDGTWHYLADLSGMQGVGVASFEKTDGNHAAGTLDTYTLTLTDGRQTTVEVYNGRDGEGSGDMSSEIYDPQKKAQDVYKYADDKAAEAATAVNAFELAKAQGYTGTEAEFYAALAALQLGPFLPLSGGTVTGDLDVQDGVFSVKDFFAIGPDRIYSNRRLMAKNATFDGEVGVTGTLAVEKTASITSDLTVGRVDETTGEGKGNLKVNGNANFRKATVEHKLGALGGIDVAGTINTSGKIVPTSTELINVGDINFRFRTGYFKKFDATEHVATPKVRPPDGVTTLRFMCAGDATPTASDKPLPVEWGGTGRTTPAPIDSSPTSGSQNPVTSGGVHTALANKQGKITASGILKGSGDGSVSAAAAGTDYLTPSSADATYLKLTGGTVSGNLRLKNSTNYGCVLNFGDGDYVHISEPEDDVMEIKANELRFSGDEGASSSPLPITWGGTGNTSGFGKNPFATCSTGASTAAKVVSITGFPTTLTAGDRVTVKFTYANTAASPTLNVNGTGAKYITTLGSTYALSGAWQANEVIDFVYDGTFWVMSHHSNRASEGTDYATYRTRNIAAGTSAMTAKTTALTSGNIYLQYE